VNPIELFGVLFGIASVWLIARENVWGWPTGLVNVALFVIVFYEAKLYADMGLQVVYIVFCLYGWYAWLRGGPAHGELHVTRTPAAAIAALAMAGVGASTTLGGYLHRSTDAALPFLDASTTSFSLVAQWMQTRKWIENWIVWIVVDTVYVGMYVYKALYFTAGLYVVFLGLAVMGWVTWRRSLAVPVVREGLVPPGGAHEGSAPQGGRHGL
jgi:nicotinamide mononucleotide transporter